MKQAAAQEFKSKMPSRNINAHADTLDNYVLNKISDLVVVYDKTTKTRY